MISSCISILCLTYNINPIFCTNSYIEVLYTEGTEGYTEFATKAYFFLPI